MSYITALRQLNEKLIIDVKSDQNLEKACEELQSLLPEDLCEDTDETNEALRLQMVLVLHKLNKLRHRKDIKLSDETINAIRDFRTAYIQSFGSPKACADFLYTQRGNNIFTQHNLPALLEIMTRLALQDPEAASALFKEKNRIAQKFDKKLLGILFAEHHRSEIFSKIFAGFLAEVKLNPIELLNNNFIAAMVLFKAESPYTKSLDALSIAKIIESNLDSMTALAKKFLPPNYKNRPEHIVTSLYILLHHHLLKKTGFPSFDELIKASAEVANIFTKYFRLTALLRIEKIVSSKEEQHANPEQNELVRTLTQTVRDMSPVADPNVDVDTFTPAPAPTPIPSSASVPNSAAAAAAGSGQQPREINNLGAASSNQQQRHVDNLNPASTREQSGQANSLAGVPAPQRGGFFSGWFGGGNNASSAASTSSSAAARDPNSPTGAATNASINPPANQNRTGWF